MPIRQTGEVALAFIIGGIIGAGFGILFAPASGKEIRKKMRGYEDSLISEAEDVIAKGKEKLLQQKNRVEEAVHAAGKEIKNAGQFIESIGKENETATPALRHK